MTGEEAHSVENTMSRHPAFNDLIAYHYGHLSQVQRVTLEQHLDACEHCAQNTELLITLMNNEKKPSRDAMAHASKHAESASEPCLSPEVISKFLCGELSIWEARKVEKHLATCEECRQKLADIIRAGASPMSQSERAFVSANSQLDVEQQLRDIERLTLPENKFGLRHQSLPHRIRQLVAPFFPLRPALSVLVILLIAGLWFVQKSFRQWQGARLVRASIILLHNTCSVPNGTLRPHGFAPSKLSEHHGDAPPKNLDEVEKKLQKALSWDSNNREAKRALALHGLFKRDLVHADSLLKVLVKEDASDFASWNDLGVVAAQREDTAAALFAFERALEIQPDYEEAVYNRTLLLQEYDEPGATQ